MIRILFILFFTFLQFTVDAQARQEVIASGGGFNENGSLSVSWTLGETFISTFTNGDIVLTQGFQQQLLITTIEESLEVLVSVKVFPNPANDFVNIVFGSPLGGEITLTLIDTYGKLIIKEIMESGMNEKQINFQNIPAGIYYLRLARGNLINVYKVVKL